MLPNTLQWFFNKKLKSNVNKSITENLVNIINRILRVVYSARIMCNHVFFFLKKTSSHNVTPKAMDVNIIGTDIIITDKHKIEMPMPLHLSDTFSELELGRRSFHKNRSFKGCSGPKLLYSRPYLCKLKIFYARK